MIYLVKIGQKLSGIAAEEIAFESKHDAQSHLYQRGFFQVHNSMRDYYQHRKLKWAMIVPLNLIKEGEKILIEQT